MLAHLPDEEVVMKKFDRDFLCNIVNTVRPNFMKRIVEEATRERLDEGELKHKESEVTITKQWADILL